MRARIVLLCVMTLTSATVVLADDSVKPKVTSAASADARRLVVVPESDVRWTDLDPKGAPGVKIADLWGDHAKGAFGAFIRLPAGFVAPLHTHTNDYKVVIVSGTYIQVPEGKPEFRLGPGSYFLQPGGNYKHITSCDTAADCVFFLESRGKFDLKVVDGGRPPPAEPAKK